MKTEKLAKIAGGRAFLDPVALSLLVPLMLVSSLLSVNHAGSFASLIGWLIANLVSFAICALVILFLVQVPFKKRAIKPIPIFLVFTVGALLGFIKGAVTALVAWRLGFFDDINQLLLSRITQTTLVGLIAIPALAVLSDFRFRYQEERDRLVLHKVSTALKRNQQAAEYGDADEKEALLNFIQQAKSMIVANVSTEAAFFIRNVIENNLRPLSHKLWDIESSKLENFDFRALVRLGLRSYPFMTKPLVIVYAPISFLFLIPIYGPLLAIGSTALGVVAVVATYGLASFMKPANAQVPVLVFGLVNAVATALIMMLPALVFGPDPTTWNIGLWLSTFILLFEIGFVSSFIAATLANHNMTRAQLNSLLAKDRTKSALENRELANFLHGNVQNRLLAIALMIESNHGERDTIVSELDRIENLLLDSFSRQSSQAQTPLRASLGNLRKLWLGFVSLEFVVVADQEFSGPLGETIVQLVNEAITNSVRHGLAKNIQIQITQTASGFEIIATDDGIGPKQGSKGIGSDYFDSVADLGWSLEPGASGGTVLKLAVSSTGKVS